MDTSQDLFISHATADKTEYVLPLARALADRNVTFWLDSLEIGWGDNVVLQINAGLQNTRFFLLCLSKAFLSRPWPESEMAAALTLQHSSNSKKLLPLILNSKEDVLRSYPILSSLAYREFKGNPSAIAEELSVLVNSGKQHSGLIQLFIESRHTGNATNIEIPAKASVQWLATVAAERVGLRRTADVGAFHPLQLRWVPVEISLADVWTDLPQTIRSEAWGFFKAEDEYEGTRIQLDEQIYSSRYRRSLEKLLAVNGARMSTNSNDKIAHFHVPDHSKFYLYRVGDDDGNFAANDNFALAG